MLLPSQPPPTFAEGLAWEDLDLDVARVRVFRFVEGRTERRGALVCLAGMGADGRSFARLAPLARERAVLPINVPFETPRGQNPILFGAKVVEAFLDAYRLERPALLGSSFGGAVATVTTLRQRHEVSALVLANAVLSRRQIPLAFPGFIDFLEAPEPIARLVTPLAVQIMGGFALDGEAQGEIAREARHFSPDELQRRLAALLGLDLFPFLRDLFVPTLAIHGNRDLLVPWKRGRWTAEAIPQSEFELIRGAGHLPYLSHPDAFNTRVGAFLREHAASPSEESAAATR